MGILGHPVRTLFVDRKTQKEIRFGVYTIQSRFEKY